jgi:thiol-disulfide isomerase/thioredoxin
MAKITDIIFQSFRTNAKTIAIVIALIAFIAVSIWCYVTYGKPAIDNEKQGDMANYGKGGKVYLHFFNVDWCPHCIKAKPEWEKFCNKYDDKEMNGFVISCVGGVNGTDCTNSDDQTVIEIIQQYSIEHYPTIKMVKDNDIIEFDAKIKYENLEKFVNGVLTKDS